MEPRQAIAKGLVAAVMQTGGLLKDLTVAETVAADRDAVRADPSGRRGAAAGRHRRHRRPDGRQVLGRPAAAAALRDGPAARPRAARPRRADDRHGRRGPARLLGRDPPGRRARAHGAVRDALPGGGRRLRRPDRPGPARPDRRRRDRRRDQGDGLRSHRAGDAAGRRPRSRCSRCPGRRLGRAPRRHGSVARQRLRRGRPAPAHPDRRTGPRDHRAEPRGRVHRPDRRRRSRRASVDPNGAVR